MSRDEEWATEVSHRSKPAVRPEIKHNIWQGRLWTLRHSTHICLSRYVKMQQHRGCARMRLQRGDVSQIAASIHAPATVCPSAWHDGGRERRSDCGAMERDAAGEEQRGTWLGQRGGTGEWMGGPAGGGF
ncbi:hypothetical protein EYF80_015441 [Liparis tanakae]|uniref:Uncharacterized protein n=1 Tax=Liparis tanakae TaxID=230148 RepID=A0A4Z2I8S8_9TELE|nr:hypothetical protein EYF80_015441 [Liparis tanakae]